jgi:hypothetical protein
MIRDHGDAPRPCAQPAAASPGDKVGSVADQPLIEQIYDAAVRLSRQATMGNVDGAALAHAVGRSARDPDFYEACKELKRDGRLDVRFGGPTNVTMVRRPLSE